MSNVYGPILPLQLDSRNTPEMVRAIQTRINIESNGALTDFTSASPLAAISEGQAFAQAELLYYLNNLPEAFSLQWFRQLGVQRIIGSRAVTTLTFASDPGYQNIISMPKGSKFSTLNGLNYFLVEDVVVPGGGEPVTGIVKSERWGTVYNVGAGEINQSAKKFIGLQYISNVDDVTNGRDLETLNEMKTRVFSLMSRRNLTTANDFEGELRLAAPEASIVKVLTYEERFDLAPQNMGGIFIVAGTPNGSAVSEAARRAITTSLKDRVVMGTTVSIIPPDVVPLNVVLDVYYNPQTLTVTLEEAIQAIYSTLSVYLSPANLGLGSDLIYQNVVKQLYSENGNIIESINNFSINLMIKDPTSLEGGCAGLSGEESVVDGSCVFDYSAVVDDVTPRYINDSSIKSFNLFKCGITLTSNVDFRSYTYVYNDIYTL